MWNSKYFCCIHYQWCDNRDFIVRVVILKMFHCQPYTSRRISCLKCQKEPSSQPNRMAIFNNVFAVLLTNVGLLQQTVITVFIMQYGLPCYVTLTVHASFNFISSVLYSNIFVDNPARPAMCHRILS